MTARPGAYVHVPYCVRRCAYCSFVTVTERDTEAAYFEALGREIRSRAGEAGGPLETVYFGGGTPSCVEPASLRGALESLRAAFGVLAGAEVTAEANPDDLGERRLEALLGLGVNRFSVGVQSLDEKELAPLERRHDAATALDALRRAARAGARVSADLMIGIPFQTRAGLRASLEGVLSAGAGHVSAYLLELEKAPRLLRLRHESPEAFADDEELAERWEEVDHLCAVAGLSRYETSNWAREGEESRHNLKYWRREPVVGLGVSAASFDGTVRRTNHGSLPAYLRSVRETGTAFAAEERLSQGEALREGVLLGLRTAAGVPAPDLSAAVATLAAADRDRLEDAFAAGLLERAGERVRLTRRGVLLSNEVFSLLV